MAGHRSVRATPRPETQGALGLPLAPDGRVARLEGRGSGPKAGQAGQAKVQGDSNLKLIGLYLHP